MYSASTSMSNIDQSTRTADSGAECRSAESHTLSRAFAATQWSTKYQTPAKKSLKDSRNRQRLHRLSEVYNTQVQHIVMNSQKVPQTVEVSQQQYTGMNVDVLVIWRHTDSAGTRTGPSLMYEWKETLSSHNDMCQRFEGYKSQYSDKASVASGVSRAP